jgi:hypothetical protein
MTPRRRSIAALFAAALALAAGAQPTGLEAELAPLQKRQSALEMTLRQSPARFIEEATALASAYASVAKKYSANPRSTSARSDAAALLARAADAARYLVKNPRQAVELYRRAAAIHAAAFSHVPAAAMVYDAAIADVLQFDARDRAAAAAALEPQRTFYSTPLPAGTELREWYVWKSKWLDAEIAWLRTGKPFAGTIDSEAMLGFIIELYYGAGAAAVSAVSIDPALNPYGGAEPIPAAELEKKLDSLPPSHTTFLRTSMFVSRLESKAAVERWLSRNDPGGYRRASMLTLAAVLDRDYNASEGGTQSLHPMVRTDGGKPTALALAARDYAKTHKLPAPMKIELGH